MTRSEFEGSPLGGSGVSAPLAESRPSIAPVVKWPERGRFRVDVDENGGEARVGPAPVWVSAVKDASSPGGVDVEFLDDSLVKAGLIDGLGMRLSGDRPGVVEVRVDVSGFAGAYGADWVSRLRAVRVSPCAVGDDVPKGCAEVWPVERFTVDSMKGMVTFRAVLTPKGGFTRGEKPEMPTKESTSKAAAAAGGDPEAPAWADGKHADDDAVRAGGFERAGFASGDEPFDLEPAHGRARVQVPGGSGTFGLSSSTTGAGDFSATNLAQSQRWNVGVGTGEFSWSYPLPAAPASSGAAPSLAVGYSSGSVDAMTAAANSQPSEIGLGWSLTSAFIERSYRICNADGTGWTITDLCWVNGNAEISLNGVASRLLPETAVVGNTRRWRLESDPDWVVTQFFAQAPPLGQPYSLHDEDYEYWTVQTPDGVRYTFGYGREPGTATETNAVQTVPVFANHSTDPCYSGNPSVSYCQQAYRWNLERVEDATGNVQSYFYTRETNKYGRFSTPSNATEYVANVVLDRVEYTKRAGSEGQGAPGGIKLVYSRRCTLLSSGCDLPQNAPSTGTASLYPDTPVDLICQSLYCTKYSPSFFSTHRLIRSEAWGYDGVSKQISQVNFAHFFSSPPSGESAKLALFAVQPVGAPGASQLVAPAAAFGYTAMANRPGFATGTAGAMSYARLTEIYSETGGKTVIGYGQPSGCAPIPAANWDTQTKDCFPQYWDPPGTTPPGWAAFNKYLTVAVQEQDLVGGSPAVVTAYAYAPAPLDGNLVTIAHPGAAWAKPQSWVAAAGTLSWNEYRGYEDVEVVAYSANPTRTRYRVFRGMNGDPVVGGGTKSMSITDGDGTSRVDERWLRGTTSTSWRVVSSSSLERSVTDWGADVTLNLSPYGVARRLSVRETRDTSTESTTKVSRDRFEYDPANGNLLRHWMDGDVSSASDDSCQELTYTNAGGRFASGLVATETTKPACVAGAVVAARSRTMYDGDLTGTAVPSKGLTTRTSIDTGVVGTAAPSYSLNTTTAYDSWGRVTSVSEPATGATTVAYTPAASTTPQLMTSMVTTNSKGHASTVTYSTAGLDVARQTPSTTVDANGAVASMVYDQLGRLTNVFLPGSNAPAPGDSVRFYYSNDATKVPFVKSFRHQANGLWQRSVTTYDGQGREIQTQAGDGTNTNHFTTRSSYDDRGLVVQTTAPFPASGPVVGVSGSVNVVPALDAAPANVQNFVTEYDLLNRPTASRERLGATVKASTTTEYGSWWTKMTPPARVGISPLDTPVRRNVDGKGRLVSLELDRAGAGPLVTSYSYDAADRLTSFVDPAAKTTSYTIDRAGRRKTSSDPDAGVSTTTYNTAGLVRSVVNAAGQSVFNEYDSLGRLTKARWGSASGPVQSEWTYDDASVANSKGRMTRSVRHISSGDLVSSVGAFDVRGRATSSTVSVPAAEGFGGPWTWTTAYDDLDHVVQQGLPAVADLPAETLNASFNANGAQTGLSNTSGVQYLHSVTFDGVGRMVSRKSGAGLTVVQRGVEYDARNRLQRMYATVGVGPTSVTQNMYFGYDEVGNVVRQSDMMSGQHVCAALDGRSRLTRAWTSTAAVVLNTDTGCAAGSESSWQQGPEPFREDYTSQPNELANLASVATDGGAAQTYGYGDAAHRGAVTAVGARSFGYDGAGRMTTRTLVAGASETLTWNPDSTLASETRAAGSSSYVYDANGQRVIRREGGVDTLYLPGVEVARTVATGVAKATRYYGAGGLVASRTAVGVQWVLGDHQGSVAGASPDGSTVASPKRYRPFGQQRGVDGTGLERGFLGQTGDSASGLSYLNARYYDAALKRFITPDPVSTPENPLNFSAYAYSHNNPTTLSDPSGLSVPECGHSCGTTYGNGRPINRPHGPSRYDKPNSAGGSARMSVAGRVSSSASPSARKVKEKLEADTTWGEDFLRLGVSTVAGFACGAVGGSVLGPAGADVAGGVCGGIVDRLVSHLQRGGSFAGAIDVAFDAKAILADGLTGAAFGKLLKVFGPKLVSLVEEFSPGAAKALSGFLGLRKSSATNSAGLADDLAGACHSFDRRTEVLMADGTRKQIGDVKVGDRVRTTDPKTGETVVRPVTAVHVNRDTDLADLTVRDADGDESTTHTTQHHRFWSDTRNTWVDAEDLSGGERLHNVDGSLVTVAGVVSFDGVQTMYDLTIDGVHTYYVEAGDQQVLVHNCGGAMTPDQQALKDLVDETSLGGRKPLSVEDADTVLDWADELGYPGTRAKPGDVADPSNWTANPVPHIHVPGAGRGGHVPVEPGVRPR